MLCFFYKLGVSGEDGGVGGVLEVGVEGVGVAGGVDAVLVVCEVDIVKEDGGLGGILEAAGVGILGKGTSIVIGAAADGGLDVVGEGGFCAGFEACGEFDIDGLVDGVSELPLCVGGGNHAFFCGEA